MTESFTEFMNNLLGTEVGPELTETERSPDGGAFDKFRGKKKIIFFRENDLRQALRVKGDSEKTVSAILTLLDKFGNSIDRNNELSGKFKTGKDYQINKKDLYGVYLNKKAYSIFQDKDKAELVRLTGEAAREKYVAVENVAIAPALKAFEILTAENQFAALKSILKKMHNNPKITADFKKKLEAAYITLNTGDTIQEGGYDFESESFNGGLFENLKAKAAASKAASAQRRVGESSPEKKAAAEEKLALAQTKSSEAQLALDRIEIKVPIITDPANGKQLFNTLEAINRHISEKFKEPPFDTILVLSEDVIGGKSYIYRLLKKSELQ